MKKTVQNAQSPIYFRYEFSDETGCPEGGDIFEYSSMAELQKMMSEVLAVAESDGVTVSFTVGQGDHFFSFLENSGLSKKEIENERVDFDLVQVPAVPAKKLAKKSAKKVTKKKV